MEWNGGSTATEAKRRREGLGREGNQGGVRRPDLQGGRGKDWLRGTQQPAETRKRYFCFRQSSFARTRLTSVSCLQASLDYRRYGAACHEAARSVRNLHKEGDGNHVVEAVQATAGLQAPICLHYPALTSRQAHHLVVQAKALQAVQRKGHEAHRGLPFLHNKQCNALISICVWLRQSSRDRRTACVPRHTSLAPIDCRAGCVPPCRAHGTR